MGLTLLFLTRLVLVLLFCQVLAARADSQTLDWTSPSPQAVYAPGDTIKGEWSSSKSIVSPCVSLCSKDSDSDDGGDCGDCIWPSVQSDGDQYSFSITAPSVSSQTDFYLRLKDDFGNKMKSPAFSLSPNEGDDGTGTKAGGSEQVAQTNGNDTQDTGDTQEASSGAASSYETSSSVPSSIPSSKASKPSSSGQVSSDDSAPAPSTTAATPSKQTGAHGAKSASQGQSSGSAISYIPAGPPTPSAAAASGTPGSLDLTPAQYATSSRATVPTAAIALPLALVGATLLVSLVLWIAHRQSVAAQRRRNAALISSQQQQVSVAAPPALHSAASFATLPSSATIPADIEKAILALHGNEDTRSVDRQGSVVYVPLAVPKPSTRENAIYGGRASDYERSFASSRSSSRMSPLREERYQYGRTPAQEYAQSFPSYGGRHPPRDHSEDYDGLSTTGSILTDYLTSYDTKHDARDSFPRSLPRSHSRVPPPCIDDMFIRDAMYTMQ